MDVNSLELVITCENSLREHAFSPGKIPTRKQDYLFKIPLILWNFPVERNFLVNGKRSSSSIGLLRMP